MCRWISRAEPSRPFYQLSSSWRDHTKTLRAAQRRVCHKLDPRCRDMDESGRRPNGLGSVNHITRSMGRFIIYMSTSGIPGWGLLDVDTGWWTMAPDQEAFAGSRKHRHSSRQKSISRGRLERLHPSLTLQLQHIPSTSIPSQPTDQ
ncbi:hypothetical protein PGT21_026285 [Puccinia graminis f. sp. tritici]|uniref:Uncharacterized protein n=1 Tax=Puccinia graminis f. sp. tritici TaxID=56615 RepID=A0A5B0MPR0_PUCGR|nr:hypothetical protein PGT21_026285 [Puccinia graminis f. sp. tritici]